MAVPKFDPKKHPHGFHGHFAPTGAAQFLRGAAVAKMHLAVKKPMAPHAPKAPARPKAPGRTVEQRIRAAHHDIMSRGGDQQNRFVGLADLREHPQLAGLSRQHVDAELVRMMDAARTDQSVRLIPVANRKALKERDHLAALPMYPGDEDPAHAIEIRGVTPPAVKASPPARGAAPVRPKAPARPGLPPDLLDRARTMYGTRRPGESDAAWAKRVNARVADVRQLGAVPKGAARARMTGTGKTSAQHVEALRGLKGTAATEYAANIKGKELDAVLQHAGVSRSGTVAVKRERLIGHAQGVTSVKAATSKPKAADPHAAQLAAARPTAGKPEVVPALHALADRLDKTPEGRQKAGFSTVGANDAVRQMAADVESGKLSQDAAIGTLERMATGLGAYDYSKPSPALSAIAETLRQMRGTSAAPSVPTKGAARAKMSAGRTGLPGTPAQAVTHLHTLDDRASANAYLAKATRADLMAVMDHANIAYGKSMTKPQLLQMAVQWTVGRRSDSNVISGHNRATRLR